MSGTEETWRFVRASWNGDDVWWGDRMRVDKGVNVKGFLTTMRLCVGVTNF